MVIGRVTRSVRASAGLTSNVTVIVPATRAVTAAATAGSTPPRAGRDRDQGASRPDELRSVRTHHNDPPVPEDVTPQDLHSSARNELKTLSKENAEEVARHLAMAAR